jgi:formylglycine-generating enzyme required for sulfatase activity
MGFSPDDVNFPDDLSANNRDHPVTISSLFLDRFEITRGRFWNFARQYRSPPAAGSGRHPRIADSGWKSDWNDKLPGDAAEMLATVGLPSDGSEPDNPNVPIHSVSWFAAFAFCIWDGGRLPTEAEWEYAAAGGIANDPYPWGESPEGVGRVAPADVPVGSSPATRGAFGQDDLAGGVREWVLDWFDAAFYAREGRACNDCANLEEGLGRGVRGDKDASCCTGLDSEFRAAARASAAPGTDFKLQGARCARDP